MSPDEITTVGKWVLAHEDLLNPDGIDNLLQLVDITQPPWTALPIWTWTHRGDDFPERLLGRSAWVRLFRLAGFTINGAPASQPTGSIRLYRGCVHLLDAVNGDGEVIDTAECMAWTSYPDVAAMYARGLVPPNRPTRGGAVFTAVVAPEHLLALVNDGDGDEWIVDPVGLHAVRHHRMPDVGYFDPGSAVTNVAVTALLRRI